MHGMDRERGEQEDGNSCGATSVPCIPTSLTSQTSISHATSLTSLTTASLTSHTPPSSHTSHAHTSHASTTTAPTYPTSQTTASLTSYTRPPFTIHRAAFSSLPQEDVDSSNEDSIFSQEAVMITECDGESYNTAATLLYCRKRILKPRDLIISILGYRPWSKDEMDQSPCCKFLNIAHFCTMLSCLCVAPVFQYNICLRRDEGIEKEIMNSLSNSTSLWTDRKSCHGNLVFVYVVPSLLFVLSYLVTCIILRLGEIEHLQTLPERVFLLASCSPWELAKQRRLWWVFLGWLLIGLTCLAFTLASLILHVIAAPPLPYVLIKPQNELEKTVLCVAALGLLWLQDVVMVMGILLYCTQCHLLSCLLNIIRASIYQGASPLISVKRQIDETSRFLRHLNQELGLSVGLYLCLVTFRASTAAITLFSATSNYLHQSSDGLGPVVSLLSMFGGTHFSQSLHFIAMVTNLVPWLVLLLVPLLTAARVTSSYRALCKAGSQLHGRPFGYQSTPQVEIDSFLLYVSSLRLQAKILWVPIRTYFLVSIIVLASVTFIILGYLYF